MTGTRDCSHHVRHDWAENDNISTTIVLAVSDLTGRPIDELTPLSDVVNPDALDELLRPEGTALGQDVPISVTFEYEGYSVTVRRDGHVGIQPSAGG